MAELVRKSIHFYGMVQGVGFRYRARYAASGLNLTGWVQNQWDDSVLMEVQGTEESINRLLVMINQGQYISIQRMDTCLIPVEPEEKGFHIR